MRAPLLVVLLAALGPSCDGRGGGTADVAVHFEAVSSTGAEGETLRVGVRLALALPALAADLPVVVSDAGTGSATAGPDYVPLAGATLVFPAGAVDGATGFVTLDLLADALFEGEAETIELALSVPGGGAELGRARHRLELLDGDSLAVEFLESPLVIYEDHAPFHAIQTRCSSPTASELARAVELTVRDLASGSASAEADYRFPPQVVRLEPGPIGAVQTSRLEVRADAASEGSETVFLQLASSDPAVAVPAPVLEVRLLDPPAPEEPLLLVRSGELGLTSGSELAFDPAAAALELELVNRGQAPLHLGFPLLDGDARDFRIELLGLDPAPVPDLSGGAAREMPAQDEDLDRPLALGARGAPAGGRPAWSLGVQAPRFPTCVLPPLSGPAESGRLDVPSADPLPVLRLAIETDRDFFLLFGSTSAAEAYVTGLVAATDEILRRELGLELRLVYLGLYALTDPWHTEGLGPLELLEEFEQRWSTEGAPAEAELNHFLSGSPLAGGVARLLGYCGPHGSFAVSMGVSGTIDWSSFDGSPSDANWDLYLFTHELGHNLGAIHTQDECPPLDQCWPNCSGGTACGPGTLMSYCHVCGGVGSIALRFHPFTADSIRHRAEFACLPEAELAGGSALRYRLTFEPDRLAPEPERRRNARLTLRHDASNAAPELSFSLVGDP